MQKVEEKARDNYDRSQSLVNFFSALKHVNRQDLIQMAASRDVEENEVVQNESEAEHDEESEQPGTTCKVCFAGIPEDGERWCLVPCGHAPFCRACTNILMDGLPPNRENIRRNAGRRTCPICRRDIHNRLQLFI